MPAKSNIEKRILNAHLLYIHIHDPDKIFLDPKIQSDENKGLTGIVTNAS
jgi:hypothetical protein